VRAVISTGVREEGLLVPQRAVARDARGQTTAMVVDANNQVERRIVQVSRTIRDQWLVEGGLAAGDRVIVEGLQKVRPGMPVRVQPDAPSSDAPPAAGSN
jgi:membrane fusion protein (multidrug efflux system)